MFAVNVKRMFKPVFHPQFMSSFRKITKLSLNSLNARLISDYFLDS